ncbi:MAG: efflux RND transporter permease subunit [Candidatus Electrothrix sp. AUS4]|nr:efflux RND transporter permease subunit [Candidatus Electrothrix sp. AUS4]
MEDQVTYSLTVSLLGLIVLGFGIYRLILQWLPKKILPILTRMESWLVILLVMVLLARSWQPLGIEKGEWSNFFFVALLIGGLLGTFQVFQWLYPHLPRIFLRWKLIFLIFPLLIVIGGAMVWLGVPKLTGWMPDSIRRTKPMMILAHSFPGLGREFMPALDEGSFLYMPTTMPHAGLTEVQEVLAAQYRAITAIPEVESAVGKLGRAETPLDPAPLSMIETIINYHPEYLQDETGKHLLFAWRADRPQGLLPQPGRSPEQGRRRYALLSPGSL